MAGNIREHRIDTGRVALSVRERAGGAPPIVLLHGLGSNARWWDLVGERPAVAYRMIAVDQRGHGRSDRPEGGYDLASAVADLGALVAALALPPAIIAGHGWGAFVALAFAVAEPDLVRGVVCVDGGVWRLRDHVGDSWELAAVALAPPEFHGLTPERMAHWVAESPLAAGSDPATAATIVLGNFDDAADDEELRPLLAIDRHMELARAWFNIDVDALLRDQRRPVMLVPAVSGDLAHQRRAAVTRGLGILGELATVRWIDGVHDLPLQRPQEVAAAIADFAREVGAGDAHVPAPDRCE